MKTNNPNNPKNTPTFTREEERLLTEWRRNKQITTHTMQTYRVYIRHYMIATGLSLQELYDEAILEEEENTPLYRRKVKSRLLDFYDYLDDSDYSGKTKNTMVFVVRSFYKSYGIRLPDIPNNYDPTPRPENVDKLLTKPIIRLMLNQASTRDKAIISFAAMTGQSADEIRRLTVQDMIDCWNSELEQKVFSLSDIFRYKKEILDLKAPPLRYVRNKTRNKYWFYIPSETSKYIIEYIYERVAGRNDKIRIRDTKTPLFVNKYGNPCTAQNISKTFTIVGERCGFETPELFEDDIRLLLLRDEGNYRVYSAHKYRKYFLNMCRRYAGTRAETESAHIYTGKELGDFWIGHQDKGSISHYLQYDEEDVHELQAHYLQLLPYLSVEMEVDVVTASDKEELNKMKQQYEDLVEEMEGLKEFVQQSQKMHRLAREYGLE